MNNTGSHANNEQPHYTKAYDYGRHASGASYRQEGGRYKAGAYTSDEGRYKAAAYRSDEGRYKAAPYRSDEGRYKAAPYRSDEGRYKAGAYRYRHMPIDNFNPFRSNFADRRTFFIPIIAIAAALVLAVVLTCAGFFGRKAPRVSAIAEDNPISNSPIRISEVCSSNDGTYAAPDGGFYDWLELQNISDSACSLRGFMLTDDINSGKLFPLPDIVLAPDQCQIIYASGKAANDAGSALHTGFKLSSAGESLYLISDDDRLYDYVAIPPLDANTSYAYDFERGKWRITSEMTPDADNAAPYAPPAMEAGFDSPVTISEIQPVNCATLPDDQGKYSDWIELFNGGDDAVNLEGWGLSDELRDPLKWTFPNVTIQPNEYILVFASGLNRKTGALHTSFSMSSENGLLTLCNAKGAIASILRYSGAAPDFSYGYSPYGVEEFLTATPGRANSDVSEALAERMARNTTGVYIEEVLSSNSTEDGANPAGYDYIELSNRSGESVELAGMGLSDNPKNPRKWQFPSGAVLEAGHYMVIYCSGQNASDVNAGHYETNFRLSASGGAVTLCMPDGAIIDECVMGRQFCDLSYGRIGDAADFQFMANATPGYQNDARGYMGKLEEVSMSVNGGLMSEPISLELSAAEGASIYYTTDMTTPTSASTPYTGPIDIASTSIIRAVAYKEGYIPSYVSTQSYFYLGEDAHHLPVVSLVADPKYLFDWETGLLVKGPNAFADPPYGYNGAGANFWMGWEYPANVEYIDINGTALSSDKVGIKIIGQDSRAIDQKGIAMYARAKYGDKSIDFNPFGAVGFENYRALTLRPSGEDAQYTHLRDATLTALAAGTSAMYQAAAPVVLYINGECWGVYNLRERINKYYAAQHEGIRDKAVIDGINIIKGDGDVLNGSFDGYEAILDFVKNNSLRDEDNLRWVTERIDIDNYIDYVLCEILSCNTDSGNIKYYQSPKSGGGKWKWVFFDLDWAMYDMDIDYFQRYLNPEGHGVRKMFDNSLIRALLKNDGIKDKFLRRMGEMLRGNFNADNILRVVDEYQARISFDMQYQFAKWGGSYERWERYLNRFKENIGMSAAHTLATVRNYFDLSESQMREYFGDAFSE